METRKLLITCDFDGTLSESYIQKVIKKLIDEGHSIWILTTRFDELHKHLYGENVAHDSLYEIAEQLGLRNRVLFTNFRWKGYYLRNTVVDIHIDDNFLEEGKTMDIYAKHVHQFPVQNEKDFEKNLRELISFIQQT